MQETIISVKDVNYRYSANLEAVRGISFEVRKGESVGILGPNGAGKSTLAMLLAGLFLPTSGDVKAFGVSTRSKEFEHVRPRIGIVFQDPEDQLFNNTVIDDVSYSLRNLGVDKESANRRSMETLELLGIAHLKDRSPHRLSYGEKKRVSIATALVNSPELLILDEPTANLDLRSRRSLVELVNLLNKQGLTLIVSTHDVEALPDLVERVLIMEGGKIVSEGPVKSIITDEQLLGEASLEPPAISRLFMRLKARGLVQEVPSNLEDAFLILEKKLSNKSGS
ncbi:MAG: ABC transporter ATP-binding protein [Candidatus Verstraetearchaeota archaeon]|nr:ABC transporter ATP-binding protein [Candidatus Verstraetearchaeota archaeon]